MSPLVLRLYRFWFMRKVSGSGEVTCHLSLGEAMGPGKANSCFIFRYWVFMMRNRSECCWGNVTVN